jgi:hypothetical protein
MATTTTTTTTLRPRPSTAAACALGALLLASSAARADAAKACRVVVLDVAGRNLTAADRELPALLTETMAHEAATVSGCEVVSRQDVAQMIDFEALRQQCGEGDSCLSEIGAALGADRVVGGTLGRLGSEWVVGARLLNVRQGNVEGRAETVVPAEDGLRLAARNATRQLFGVAPLPAPAGGSSSSSTAASPSSPRAAGPSALLLAGVVTGATGTLAAGAAGALAGVAEVQLGDPAARGKQTITDAGRVALGAATIGVVVAVVGGTLVVVDLITE